MTERADSLLLRTIGLTKIFRGDGVSVPALRGVDMALHPGEFAAIIGPSGSGKSTLLHVVGGLEPPTSGEIWLNGERVDRRARLGGQSLRRRHIGFVFQFFNLVSNMTVADNVELAALMGGATRKRARERREELLAELGLEAKANAAPARLSGGEQQRVALARAMANRPSLLLADEPTGNLDSTASQAVIRLLATAHAGGQAILLVTHDARVASTADRVISSSTGPSSMTPRWSGLGWGRTTRHRDRSAPANAAAGGCPEAARVSGARSPPLDRCRHARQRRAGSPWRAWWLASSVPFCCRPGYSRRRLHPGRDCSREQGRAHLAASRPRHGCGQPPVPPGVTGSPAGRRVPRRRRRFCRGSGAECRTAGYEPASAPPAGPSWRPVTG